MKTLPREEAAILFDQWWDELRSEWFKIEVLQDYSGEDDGESLQAWLSGNREKSVELMKENYNREWVKSCQEKINNGIKLIRVHIVNEPLSPYLEWEIEHYKNVNIPLCGEEVLVCKSEKLKDIQLPRGDVMIFDTQRVVKNIYTETGRMIEQTFYEKDTQEFLHLKERILKHSLSLDQF